MTTRTICITFLLICLWVSFVSSQDGIIETIDQAKQFYLEKNLSETIDYLNQAVELINKEILTQVESVFPEPLKKWRTEAPFSRATKTAYTSSLVSNRKYYKEGGGQSVEIEIQTNAPRIANIKMAFVNPLVVKQLGDGAKISTVNDRRCIERYDPIDKFAELVFVPTSSVLITIRGYEMKNIDVVAKYAAKLKWDLLGEIFP